MFLRFTDASVRIMQRWLPDPLLFAIILSFITFFAGILITGHSPMEMVVNWGEGFWGLLTFSMQMVLILVTGHTLASAPIIKAWLRSLAKLAKTPTRAIMLVTFVSAIACWINWGFGLVIGALFARELARNIKVDYRLLIAAAYSGFLVWQGGISSSVALAMATPANVVYDYVGIVPTNQSIFSGYNLLLVALFIITLPFINSAMHPKRDEDIVLVDPAKLEDAKEETKVAETPAEKLENSRIISYVIGLAGLMFVVRHFIVNGFLLDLNLVNFMFLMLGIILHGTPASFLKASSNAVRGASGIVVQFPFYAGISGMMTGVSAATGLSLAALITNGFVNVATAQTLPFLTFISAGLLNIFVPSGGGQWAVQGPVIMPAAIELGADSVRTAMALAWGDAWTNMIQPFWALPALAIAGLSARDIMGFLVSILIYSGIAIGIVLTFV